MRSRYNLWAYCVEYYYGCEELGGASWYTSADYTWAAQLHVDMDSIMAKWDGSGSQVEDVDAVSEFIA